jgi:hypothetical protein
MARNWVSSPHMRGQCGATLLVRARCLLEFTVGPAWSPALPQNTAHPTLVETPNRHSEHALYRAVWESSRDVAFGWARCAIRCGVSAGCIRLVVARTGLDTGARPLGESWRSCNVSPGSRACSFGKSAKHTAMLAGVIGLTEFGRSTPASTTSRPLVPRRTFLAGPPWYLSWCQRTQLGGSFPSSEFATITTAAGLLVALQVSRGDVR